MSVLRDKFNAIETSICPAVAPVVKKHFCLEVVSKPSIGLKVKAGRGVQSQEYMEYFED